MTFIYLPYLIMHYRTYVIIGPEGDIKTQVAQALAPFSESIQVEPYKVYLDEREIFIMAMHFGLKENNIPALIEEMPDWRKSEGGVDEVGLFSWTTANPKGKWDYYVIGGLWSRNFHGRNSIKARTLLKSRSLKEHLPCSILSPSGEWHEVEELVYLGLNKFKLLRKCPGGWLIALKQILARYPEHRVVCVDVHR